MWLSLIFFLSIRDHHYSQGYISNRVRTILGTDSRAHTRSMWFSITRCCKETSCEYTLFQSNAVTIPDAIIKILLWGNFPSCICSETAMKHRYCSWSAPLLLFIFQTGSKYFCGSFLSDIYFSRATGNEADLTKWMEAMKTFVKYSWTLQTKYTWGLFNQRQNIFKWFIKNPLTVCY